MDGDLSRTTGRKTDRIGFKSSGFWIDKAIFLVSSNLAEYPSFQESDELAKSPI